MAFRLLVSRVKSCFRNLNQDLLAMWKFSQDLAMGIAIILTCLMILFREQWFLAETTKGQRLVQRFGAVRALWILRGLLLAIAILGGLLAAGIIHPARW